MHRLAIILVFLIMGKVCLADQPENAIYVWQRQWSPEVIKGVGRFKDQASLIMVQAAELQVEAHGDLALKTFPVPWKDLAGLQLCAVIRCPVGLATILQTAEGRQTAADLLLNANDLKDRPLQIDFDCPTSKLSVYTQWLALLSDRSGGLAITALPTWLGSREFAKVVARTDYFVLQVHGLERPGRITDPATLLPMEKLESWFAQAAALHHPWFVALPTYGYLIHFDGNGDFVGLTAEGRSNRTEPNGKSRLLMADPEAIAGIVSRLQQDPLAACRGDRLVSLAGGHGSAQLVVARLEGSHGGACTQSGVRRRGPSTTQRRAGYRGRKSGRAESPG